MKEILQRANIAELEVAEKKLLKLLELPATVTRSKKIVNLKANIKYLKEVISK